MSKSSRWIYHYTNGLSARRIICSKNLKASKGGNGDIKLGEGVYLTKMSPDEYTDEQLFYNNYGAATLEGKSHEDVQYYIKIAAPDIGYDRLICRFKNDREIFVLGNSDIDLNQVRFSVGRRKGGNIEWELRDDKIDILDIEESANLSENSPLDLMVKYEKAMSQGQEKYERKTEEVSALKKTVCKLEKEVLNLKREMQKASDRHVSENKEYSEELIRLAKKISSGDDRKPWTPPPGPRQDNPVKVASRSVPDILEGDGMWASMQTDPPEFLEAYHIRRNRDVQPKPSLTLAS